MTIQNDPGVNPLAYLGVRAVNPPNVIQSSRAPTSSDVGYQIGTLWIDTITQAAYELCGYTSGVPGWVVLGGGSSDVSTLTGDSGGAISPTGGNINLLGTANQITTTGSGSTITWSLPSAITTPGSLTTTTTLTGGTGITATTGNIVATAGNISTTAGSISSHTTLTAGTGITATTGNITATNGNLSLGTAGNKLSIATGSNASLGTSSALSSGNVTVATTAVTSSSKIFLTRAVAGGTLGNLSVGTISAGVNFTITCDSSSDTSTVNWLIIN